MKPLIEEEAIAAEVIELGNDILLSEKFQAMKTFTQHGSTSVFEHVLSVAKMSLVIAIAGEQFFGIKVDRRSLIRGALLHDYFLYDWHTLVKGHNVHGFTHPGTALRNAKRDFEINDIEANLIKTHMFPLTPFIPKYKESVTVCLADKICAICETFKIDICSNIIYKVNLHYFLSKGVIVHEEDSIEA